MNTVIKEITQRENNLYKRYGGNIPESNSELNDLQREKIKAIYEHHGAAYIGKINFYDAERKNLTIDKVFTEYTGQMIYNFGADYIIPLSDNALAKMIVEWNSGLPTSLNLIGKIIHRIDEIGGANLIWS